LISNEHLNLLKKEKIKIFRYLLLDEKVDELISFYNIDLNTFLKKFVVIYNDFLNEISFVEKNKNSFLNSIQFLNNSALKKSEIVYILRVLRNSIFLFLNNNKIDNFIIKKAIDESFDFFFDCIMENGINNNFIDYSNELLDEKLLTLKIDESGKILDVSKAFCKLFLYDKNELISKESINLWKDNSFFKNNFKNILSHKDLWEGEVSKLKSDGTIFFANLKIEPYYNDEGLFEYFNFLLDDITLKKNVEKYKKIFLEQSKSAAMGELISMIAHQWRQPLQTVSILVQKLILTKIADGYVDNKLLEKTVQDVETQLEYMSKTIDDFRNFFQPNKEKTLHSLSYIINKSVSFLTYILTINSINVKVEIKNDIELLVYENNIIQVLMNIIKNAKDVLIQRDIKEKNIFIRCDFNEKYAIIEIEDNAGGVEEKNLKKIFEPYFTTKNKENGTGLGLYMSKIIIEEYSSGVLSVENSSNGALFKILLPLK